MYKILLSSSALVNLVAVFATGDPETVVIKSDNGPVRINKSDYNEKEHTLHEADRTHDADGVERTNPDKVDPNNPPQAIQGANKARQPKTAKTDDDNAAAAKDQRIIDADLAVIDDDKRFYVIDKKNNNQHVEIDGIDAKGYKTNKEAWEVLLRVRKEAEDRAKARDEASAGKQPG